LLQGSTESESSQNHSRIAIHSIDALTPTIEVYVSLIGNLRGIRLMVSELCRPRPQVDMPTAVVDSALEELKLAFSDVSNLKGQSIPSADDPSITKITLEIALSEEVHEAIVEQFDQHPNQPEFMDLTGSLEEGIQRVLIEQFKGSAYSPYNVQYEYFPNGSYLGIRLQTSNSLTSSDLPQDLQKIVDQFNW
jgi:hypothetical protein